MKRAALVVAALAVSPVAAAQDVAACELYKQIIEAAPSGFAAYHGEPIPGRAGGFVSTTHLHGFRCLISASDSSGHGFVCYSPGVPEHMADMRYQLDVLDVRKCFPDWATRTPDSMLMEGDPIMEESIQFFRHVDSAEVTVGVLHARMDGVGQASHMIGFGITWRSLPVGS